MKEKSLTDQGYCLNEIAMPSGDIYTAEVISFLDRHAYVKDIDHSLRLINRKKR